MKYILDELNNLDAQMREKRRTPSDKLMKFIERRAITATLSRGIQPTRENLNKVFESQVAKYGHVALYYRDMAKQQSQVMVNAALEDLKMKEQYIIERQEDELEMNLQELGERDKGAKLTFLEMAKIIDEVGDLMAFTATGDVGQLAQKAALDKLVKGSPILEYAKLLAERNHLVKNALEALGAPSPTGLAKVALKNATFGAPV